MVLVAIDTNILACAEGADDESRRVQSVALLARLPEAAVIIPVQVLGELYRVLVGKLRQTPVQAREAVLHWSDAYEVRDSTSSALQSAFDLSAAHGLGIWDSLILSVASEQRCRVLLSEDMQHGFTWRGTTVVNPFAQPAHALLSDLFEPRPRAQAQVRASASRASVPAVAGFVPFPARPGRVVSNAQVDRLRDAEGL